MIDCQSLLVYQVNNSQQTQTPAFTQNISAHKRISVWQRTSA